MSEVDRIVGLERDLVNWFCETQSTRHLETRIPSSKFDKISREMSFRFGRADIVIFHADGTASVIEAKDGSKGYKHVVSGIGQVGLYAAQLGMNRGALKNVRRCLLWTSVGQIMADALIEEACERAGVIPLPWGRMDAHMSAYQSVISKARNG